MILKETDLHRFKKARAYQFKSTNVPQLLEKKGSNCPTERQLRKLNNNYKLSQEIKVGH